MGSIGKILIFVIVVMVAWFGWRYFRIREKEADIAAQRAKSRDVAKADMDAGATTMRACPRCGTFIAAGLACTTPGCRAKS